MAKHDAAGTPAKTEEAQPDPRDAEMAALRAELASARAAKDAAESSQLREIESNEAALKRMKAERDSAYAEAASASKREAAARAAAYAAQDALAGLREEIRVRPLAPGARAGAPVFFAKCEISNSGSPVRPGEPLPFDPTIPPPGFDGLVEGIHYTRG